MLEDDQAARIEPEVHAREVVDRSQEERGADDERDGDGDLDEHERAPGAQPRRGRAGAALAHQVGRLPRRPAAAPGTSRNASAAIAETRREPISVRRRARRRWRGGATRERRDQRRRAPEGQQDAERAAGRREHEALDEGLAHEPCASGAEREADPEFPLTRDAAREHEARDVHAGDAERRAPATPPSISSGVSNVLRIESRPRAPSTQRDRRHLLRRNDRCPRLRTGRRA